MDKLVLDNVGITYFGGYKAVSGVSFTLHKGEVMTVFGELGSGKSSLLKLIATLEKPTSGTIKVDDKPIEETELRYQNIAFATNELPLMKGKTVYENIAYPLKIRKVDKAVIDAEVKKIAKRCGLYNILGEKVKFIGEDVRAFVILARAFVLERDLYLIDNVLEKVDTIARDYAVSMLMDIVSELDGAVIYATDRREEVSMVAGDNCLMLSHGEMIDKGDISKIYSSPSTLSSMEMLGGEDVCAFSRDVQRDDKGKYIELDKRTYIDIDDVYVGKPIIVGIRCDDVSLEHSTDSDNLVAKIARYPLYDRVSVSVGHNMIIVRTKPCEYKVGEGVSYAVKAYELFDSLSERRIVRSIEDIR